MHSRVQDLRAKATASRQKAEEAKASQAANTSQSKVLESLTKLSATGRIAGFHVSVAFCKYSAVSNCVSGPPWQSGYNS
jgi:hypothetical protein